MESNEQQSWPENFDERFHIFALGEAFDVDAFQAESTLRPDFVWRRMGNGPKNGVEFLLGDAQNVRLFEQERLAVTYLKENVDELSALARFPGVEALNLGFQLTDDTRAEHSGIVVGPPPDLMHLALIIGLSPLYYVTILRR